MTPTKRWFSIGTNESRARGERDRRIEAPSCDFTPEVFSDPFGVRRAIAPVFERDPDGKLQRVGAAFHVDGWGHFLTAHHVVDCYDRALPDGIRPETTPVLDPRESTHAVLLLAMGLVFGTVGIPRQNWADVVNRYVLANDRTADNPLAALRGASTWQVDADIAAVQALIDPRAKFPESVPVRLSAEPLELNEPVIAFGFPNLTNMPMDSSEEENLLQDELCAAPGVVLAVHPNGRAPRNRTPVFEVKANWGSGMSGGPVFNLAGEVVGIVSRSVDADLTGDGVGLAVDLTQIRSASLLLPTLDINPCCRAGFWVVRESNRQAVRMFPSKELADRFAASQGRGHVVKRGIEKIGTDEHMFEG